eukprot:GFYU01003470.1.p1 GENE.GFYU01003470.1~~GFYU01003470.1.p1  ORF type:complete len:528 (-),score=74.17 GFYU01003470.1:46-1629(-)
MNRFRRRSGKNKVPDFNEWKYQPGADTVLVRDPDTDQTFQAPPVPATEAARNAALERYDILDTEEEQNYENLTSLAANVLNTPIALISLVHKERQWFKSHHGLDVVELPRATSFCAHGVVNPDQLLVVEDATADPRFGGNPLVQGAPDIRFYAGTPLISSTGHCLGMFCVIDSKPRNLGQADRDTLRSVGRQVSTELELRLSLKRLKAQISISEQLLQNVIPPEILEKLKTQSLEDASRTRSLEAASPENGPSPVVDPPPVEKKMTDIFRRKPKPIDQVSPRKVRRGSLRPNTQVYNVPVSDRATSIAEEFDCVSIVFSDLVEFTKFSDLTPATTVVSILGALFTELDDVAKRMGVMKIKTIGDGYMAAVGLSAKTETGNHADIAVEFAKQIHQVVNHFNTVAGTNFEVRAGVNSGPVVAGIVGRDKFSYDVWGDTVNTASRMESSTTTGCVQISAATYDLLDEDMQEDFAANKATKNIKGKGEMTTYTHSVKLAKIRTSQAKPLVVTRTTDGTVTNILNTMRSKKL